MVNAKLKHFMILAYRFKMFHKYRNFCKFTLNIYLRKTLKGLELSPTRFRRGQTKEFLAILIRLVGILTTVDYEA